MRLKKDSPARPNKALLVLHPIRLRILEALKNRPSTSTEIGVAMPEIPPATLYRHIRILQENGLIVTAATRQRRGAVERTYLLAGDPANLTLEEFDAMTAPEHREAFEAVTGYLAREAHHYLGGWGGEQRRASEDGFIYYGESVYMTQPEFREFWKQFRGLVAPFVNRGPGTGRARRSVFGIAIPEIETEGAGKADGAEEER